MLRGVVLNAATVSAQVKEVENDKVSVIERQREQVTPPSRLASAGPCLLRHVHSSLRLIIHPMRRPAPAGRAG